MIVGNTQPPQKTSDDTNGSSVISSTAKKDFDALNSKSDTEKKLRPSSFEEYIGQAKIMKQLRIIIDSAKIRSTIPEHLLFYGQPGLGKTTLASLISQELNLHLKIISAPALQKIGDMVSLLVNMEPNTVLFIDEIHRLKAPLEETLYTAMEDKQIDLLVGKGQGATSMRIDLEPFVLVGATTQLGKLSKPLKDRFPNVFQLEAYGHGDMLLLVDRSCEILKLQLDNDAMNLVCRRCRGVPRIANNILKRLRDLQTVSKKKLLNYTDTLNFLEDMGVYEFGLMKTDVKYMMAIEEQSASLKTLSGLLMEEVETIETVIEPYLTHLGFIMKSSEGRGLTQKGRKHIQDFAHNL